MATLDFSDAGALDVVTTAATSELANLAGLESADLTTELADVKSAVTVIAGQIAAVTDFEDLRNDADGVLAAANYLSTAGNLDCWMPPNSTILKPMQSQIPLHQT